MEGEVRVTLLLNNDRNLEGRKIKVRPAKESRWEVLDKASKKWNLKIAQLYDRRGALLEDLRDVREDDIIFCSQVGRPALTLQGEGFDNDNSTIMTATNEPGPSIEELYGCVNGSMPPRR